ncbi:MAG: HAD family hydrolase [Alphaproteobacteria bacterium]
MSPRLARPRAVLLDWDGTLVDSWDAIHAALVGTQVAFGVATWTLDETRQKLQSLREHFPILFGERWRAALDDYRARYYATHLEHLKVCAGAEALLDRIGAVSGFTAVVSNKLGTGLRREAEHLGWTGRFDRLVGSGDAARDKPDPAPLLEALATSGIALGPDVWLVGDSVVDVLCARNAGCRAILVGDDADAVRAADAAVVRARDCHALEALVAPLKADVD